VNGGWGQFRGGWGSLGPGDVVESGGGMGGWNSYTQDSRW